MMKSLLKITAIATVLTTMTAAAAISSNQNNLPATSEAVKTQITNTQSTTQQTTIKTIQFVNHTPTKFVCFTGKLQLQLASSHKLILPGASSLSAPPAMQAKISVNDSWTCRPGGGSNTKLYSLIGTIDTQHPEQLNIDIKPINQPVA